MNYSGETTTPENGKGATFKAPSNTSRYVGAGPYKPNCPLSPLGPSTLL